MTLIERGNTAAHLAARRKRDNPDIAEQLAAGIVLEPSVVRSEFVKRRDKALLAALTPWERELVQQAMDNHPALPLAKTIAMLKAAGMWISSSMLFDGVCRLCLIRRACVPFDRRQRNAGNNRRTGRARAHQDGHKARSRCRTSFGGPNTGADGRKLKSLSGPRRDDRI